MRFNDLLHLIATLAPRLDRGDSLGRRMGDLRRPVSTQPRCRIPVRFPIPQTNFSPYIPLSAFAAGSFPRPRTNILRESCSLREQPQGGQSPSQEQRTTPEDAGDSCADHQNCWTSTEWLNFTRRPLAIRQPGCTGGRSPGSGTVLSGVCGEPFPPVSRRRGARFPDTCLGASPTQFQGPRE